MNPILRAFLAGVIGLGVLAVLLTARAAFRAVFGYRTVRVIRRRR